ncbi:MAG TPA: hypothetical protein VGX27_04435 [Candidatus Dormibacteraeota bacterium]|nr:hypothetical protein [Candidatus Dormibacteraeota bacterium]
MAYLVAGPLVALIGIGAVLFVFRRKGDEKRSMYSARRSQIEHKVRAARQRTLAPHGHAPKAPEAIPPAPGSAFDQAKVQPTITYDAPAYQAPPVAPPSAPPARPEPAAEPMPWEQPTIPAPSSFDYPVAQPEPYTPAPEPAPMPSPSEPVWTPAPRPAEPLPPAETVAPAPSTVASASASSTAGGWSIVSTEKESSPDAVPSSKKKAKRAASGSEWSLASGGLDSDEPEVRRPSSVMGIAYYAVLVVGLVMVLIGVLVMVANSHVT